MGREPKDVTLGELSFRVTPFGGRRGYDLFGEVTRAVGPALAQGASSLDFEKVAELDTDDPGAIAGMFESINFGGLAKAVETLYSRIDQNTWWNLTWALLGGVEVRKDQALARAMGGKDATATEGGWMPLSEPVFDMIFAANIGPVFHLIALVVEVNWKGPLASYLGSLSGK